MSVSTHVLDTARGRPAKGVPVTLSHRGTDRRWSVVGRGTTDADGEYRLEFDTARYFQEHGDTEFYPEVSVVFAVEDSRGHLHIPLLLSPFGYSTYKGT